MALIFIEGFDKYGVPNNNNTSGTSGIGCTALLVQGDWTIASANPTFTVVPGLSATGGALQLPSAGAQLQKTLSSNYPRLIGGARFNSNLVSGFGFVFYDGATAQCSIVLNTNGTISVRQGLIASGTILATSSVSVTASSTHYLEWDITFSGTGAYQVWLDGVSIISGTGDTTGTANNYANIFNITNGAGSPVNVIDDLYLMDTTGATNNAALLTSPRVETSFPASDGVVQFEFGAATLGSSTGRGTWVTNGLNWFWLRQVIPARNCTLNSLSFVPQASSGAINLRGIVYSDNGGVPGTLMTSGSTVVGMTASSTVTLPLTAPQALTAGSPYWIGLMVDIQVVAGFFLSDSLNIGRVATVTFSSGAPGTAPVTTTTSTPHIWGNVTGVAPNWALVTGPPPNPNMSFVFDSVVGQEDLYNFTPLTTPPAAIYAVAVKAYCSKSDAGTRTVSMRMKSGATDSAGSAAGQAMGTTYSWLTSYFPTDPNTGAAWTPANLNAAQSGFRIDA